jgi:hypothetical protein
MMTAAHWVTQKERDGFPVEKAAVGSCDLSVVYVGGYWEWLVRDAGGDLAEGMARTEAGAKRQAEEVAAKAEFLDLVVRFNSGEAGHLT